jgi:hypothetical protein
MRTAARAVCPRNGQGSRVRDAAEELDTSTARQAAGRPNRHWLGARGQRAGATATGMVVSAASMPVPGGRRRNRRA